MTDIFTNLLNLLLTPIVNAYGQMLAGFPLNFLSYIISSILLALFMQVVFSIFPWLKSIVESLCFPFRMIHMWLHVQQAKEVMKKQAEKDPNGRSNLRFVTYFNTGFSAKTEMAGLTLSGVCTPKEAASIANAPLKGVAVMLFVLTLLTPVLRTSFIGVLIHLYIFIGIATVSFPSASDYQYTRNMMLLNTSFTPRWTVLPVAAFTVGFLIAISLLGNLIYAAIWGVSAASVALWAVMMVTTRLEDKNPDGGNNRIKNRFISDSSPGSVNHYHYDDEITDVVIQDNLNNLEYNF